MLLLVLICSAAPQDQPVINEAGPHQWPPRLVDRRERGYPSRAYAERQHDVQRGRQAAARCPRPTSARDLNDG
jgi:hypothetical protein